MASDERPISLPVAICAVMSVLVSLFLGTLFLRKKRWQHGNSASQNVQPPHPETDESHCVPSSSSSSDPDPGHEFEVFLSFRGSDNRKTFTDNLYHRLLDAGIRTFRDDEELEVGEEIGPKLMKSIKQSKIAIPIFSKDYASSKWCLKEFTEIVKCMKDTKLQIMPVFLDVTPDEVQHQTGSYADSFTRHEKRFGSDIVQGWRDALQEVVKLKGLELKTVANGYEGEFIKLIVAKVNFALKKSYLEVSNTLVGIEDRAEDLLKRLEVGIDDTRVVGVWGMGGIGKTTLAKHVYNQIVDKFPSNSFLNNIRETCRNPRGLQSLQSKLASDILSCEREEFADTGEAIKVLKDRLRDKKALIFLDDVDHIDQLSALAKDLRWFGRGSRIIITTREMQVLDQFRENILGQFQNELPNQFQVQDPYEVALLDKDQAFELFCQHAFRDKLPRPNFEEHAWEAVKISGRLPLALEVIGSHLSALGGRRDEWKSTLDKLKEMQHKDVQAILKISCNSLDRKEIEIFLDIACFFIGMDVRLVIPLWHDSKLYPELGIEILKHKALVKIGEDNTIWMHDQIRDLGRHIVELENHKEPGERSRVWHGDDTFKILLGQQGTSKVEAISLEGNDFGGYEDCVTPDMFKNLSRLKILELNRVRLDGNFQNLFQELKWLSWHSGVISARQKLIMKNLIVLDLSRSSLADNWMCTMKMGVKLKVLNLTGSQISRTPDFSAFPNLEILILAECGDLVWVDPSIGLLKNMILLDVRRCLRLEKLPEELGKVESLVELLVDNTRVRELPISPGMNKLEILSARACNELEELPSNLGSLKKLKVLNASHSSKLHDVEISNEFLSLSSLTVLHLCRVKSLPPSMSALSCLHTLYIGDSPNLQSLPELPSSLSSLNVEAWITKLVPLNLTNLANLEELVLFGNFELKEECFSGLRKLERMNLTISKQETLPDFGNLLSLKQLGMYCCSLKELPDLSKSKNLERLEVAICEELVHIQGLGSLGNCLKVLKITGCSKLSQVEDIAGLESMRELNLCGCTSLRKLPELSKLQSLKEIDMSCGVDIDGFSGVLNGLTNLERLHLNESGALVARLGDHKTKALHWYRNYILSKRRGDPTNEEDKEAQVLIDRGIITEAEVDEIKSKPYYDPYLIREVEINVKTISIEF